MIATYDRTIFKDENCGFCICGFHTQDPSVPAAARSAFFKDDAIHFTATGYLFPETSSIQLDLDGVWKKSKYGLQLAVEHFHEVIPQTQAGIVGYLSSGLIKGIGPKTAQAVFDAFGSDALQVLETEPDKLLQIKGITPKRLGRILDSYRASAALRELVSYLSPFGITANKCARIQQAFGGKAVQTLRENPFTLCQIPGFGFKTVDEIARKIKCAPDDPLRIRSALLYALDEGGSAGHVYLPQKELFRQAGLLLNEGFSAPMVDESMVSAQLYVLATHGKVCLDDGLVYQKRLYAAEQKAAEALVHLIRQPMMFPSELEQKLQESQQELGLMLSPKQCDAVRTCFQHSVSIITGGPGTGKTTVLRVILDLYQKLEGGTILQAAPTGRAARRMTQSTGLPAGTLHSALGLVALENGGAYHANGLAPLAADFIVIDETSMVDIELAKELFTRIRSGARLLLVGDANQLPSVGPGNVFRDLVRCGVIPVTQLDVVFRQSGASRIALNAQYIQQNRAALLEGPDFQWIPCPDEQQAAALIQRFYLEEVKLHGIEQVQVLSPFASRGCASVQALNLALRDQVNPARFCVSEIESGGTLFRVGDRVVQTKNCHDVSNGDTGFIRGIQRDAEDGTVKVQIEFGEGRTVQYDREELSHLKLAYALTIHKSQGSEYVSVILPMLPSFYKMLSRNLLYTAITRAKKRVILVGQKKALYMAIHQDRSDDRNSLLANRIERLFYSREEISEGKEPV